MAIVPKWLDDSYNEVDHPLEKYVHVYYGAERFDLGDDGTYTTVT